MVTNRMTPTRTVQSFLDAKRENQEPGPEVWNSLKRYRTWNEPELIGLRNASAYCPEIYFEEGMDQTIEALLQKIRARIVPHTF